MQGALPLSDIFSPPPVLCLSCVADRRTPAPSRTLRPKGEEA